MSGKDIDEKKDSNIFSRLLKIGKTQNCCDIKIVPADEEKAADDKNKVSEPDNDNCDKCDRCCG